MVSQDHQSAKPQPAWLEKLDVRALLALVALDALLKIVAYILLPLDEPVNRSESLQLVLRLNRGYGSWLSAHIPQELNGTGDLSSITFNLTLAFMLVWVRRWQKPTWQKIVACLVVTLVAAVLGTVAHEASNFSLATLRSLFVLQRVTGAVLFVVIWRLVPDGLWKLTAFLLAASAVGNSLSFLYPPFAVVDYIYFRPLTLLTGMGIFNLADVTYLLSLPVGAAALWKTLRRAVFRN